MNTPEGSVTPKSYFEGLLNEASSIQDQNERYDTTLADPTFNGEYEEFRQLAIEGLHSEQMQTVEYFLGQDLTAYDAVAEESQRLSSELNDLQNRIENVTDEEDARRTHLALVAERAITLAPLAEHRAHDLLQHRIEDLDTLNRAALTERHAVIQAEKQAVDEAYEVAATAWPVPRIPHPILTTAADIVDDFYTIEDEMPASPHIVDFESEQRKGRLVEKFGYTHSASLLASIYFMEHEGEILTALDIGREVYRDSAEFIGMDEATVEKAINNRIVSLLNANRGIAATMLHEEGYDLHYGRRIVRNSLDKQVGNARILYSAVKRGTVEEGSMFTQIIRDQGTEFQYGSEAEIANIELDQEDIVENVDTGAIEIIEQSVHIQSREERWTERVDIMIDRAEKLLPWLKDRGFMPSEYGEKVNAQFMHTKISQYKATRNGFQTAPVEIGPMLTMPGSTRGYRLTASAVLHLFSVQPNQLKHMPKHEADRLESEITKLLKAHYNVDEEEAA